MKLRTWPGLFVLFALLAAFPARGDEGDVAVKDDADYVHQASGLKFPSAVGELRRVDIHRFNEAGTNVSIGYNAPKLLLIATAYVYPAEDMKLAEHFDEVKKDVMRYHEGAAKVGEGPWKLHAADKEPLGLEASFRMTDEFLGERRELISRAYLAKIGTHFLKFRITYPAANPDAAEKQAAALIDALVPKSS